MELISMLLVLPLAVIIAFVYTTLITAAFQQWQKIRFLFLMGSYAVFILVCLEILLLLLIGPRKTFIYLGQGYTLLHFFNFIFQSAAITNISIHHLMKRVHWIIVVALCSVLCFFCIIMTLSENIVVDESIAGINAPKPFFDYSPEELEQMEK